MCPGLACGCEADPGRAPTMRQCLHCYLSASTLCHLLSHPMAPAAFTPANSDRCRPRQVVSKDVIGWPRQVVSKHWLLLLGTSGAWFLLDITFYGAITHHAHSTCHSGYRSAMAPVACHPAVLFPRPSLLHMAYPLIVLHSMATQLLGPSGMWVHLECGASGMWGHLECRAMPS